MRGDKWAPGFVSEAFAKHDITYRYSVDDRSEIYLGALPLLTSGRARLLDSDRMAAQFVSLERRTGTSGRDRIDHPKEQHDDLANAVAGALVLATRVKTEVPILVPVYFGLPPSIPGGTTPRISDSSTTTTEGSRITTTTNDHQVSQSRRFLT